VITFLAESLSYSIDNTPEDMEALSITIQTLNGSLRITNVYHPPATPLCETAMRHIFSYTHNHIITGKFNSFSPL